MALSKKCEYNLLDLVDAKIALQDTSMSDAAKKTTFDKLFTGRMRPMTTTERFSNYAATWNLSLTGNTGNGSTINLPLPPYYVLAYIMKL